MIFNGSIILSNQKTDNQSVFTWMISVGGLTPNPDCKLRISQHHVLKLIFKNFIGGEANQWEKRISQNKPRRLLPNYIDFEARIEQNSQSRDLFYHRILKNWVIKIDIAPERHLTKLKSVIINEFILEKSLWHNCSSYKGWIWKVLSCIQTIIYIRNRSIPSRISTKISLRRFVRWVIVDDSLALYVSKFPKNTILTCTKQMAGHKMIPFDWKEELLQNKDLESTLFLWEHHSKVLWPEPVSKNLDFGIAMLSFGLRILLQLICYWKVSGMFFHGNFSFQWNPLSLHDPNWSLWKRTLKRNRSFWKKIGIITFWLDFIECIQCIVLWLKTQHLSL